jgi:hypothetical protein
MLPAPEAGDFVKLILMYTALHKKSQLPLCRCNVGGVQSLVSLNLFSHTSTVPNSVNVNTSI